MFIFLNDTCVLPLYPRTAERVSDSCSTYQLLLSVIVIMHFKTT